MNQIKLPGVRFPLIFLALLLISGAVFYAVSVPRYEIAQQAAGGVLDMSGANFGENFYALDGEWEFYFGQLLSPGDFASGRPEGKTFVLVPHSWDTDGYPLYGFATYRLILLTDAKKLSMFIPEISDSGVVYINGERVLEAGRPGRTAEETISGVRNAIVHLYPENGQVEIIVQAANFGWWASGLRYEIEVGSYETILADVMVRRLILGIFIGVLLAVFLYHIMLYLHRRKEKVYLIFSIYCLVVAARFFTESNGLAQILLPGGVGPFMTNVQMFSTYLQSLLLTLFTHAIFNIPIRNKWLIAVYAASFAVAFGYVALPYGAVNVQITYAALIPLAMSFISAVRRTHIRQNPYNLMYLIIMAVMNIWYPAQKILLQDLLFMPGIATNLFMIMTQCLVISVSYAEAHANAARLEDRLRYTERQISIQREQYERIMENAEMAKAIHHDIRHHLAVIGQLAEEENAGKIGGYIESITGKLATASDISYCVNYEVNAIAAHYLGIAESEGIAVETRLNIPKDTGRVPAVDLCVILGNFLENALEACRRMERGERYIHAHSVIDGDTLSIVVTNSFDGVWSEKDGAYISHKEESREGVGLPSVKSVCEKYRGLARFTVTDGVWKSSALVHIE